MFNIFLLFVSLVIIFDENRAESPFKPRAISKGYTTGPELIAIVTQPLVFTGSFQKEVMEAPVVPNIDAVYRKYGFQYVVSDPKSGDSKLQLAQRDGDLVQGQYTLFDTNGSTRAAKYTTVEKNGFNAGDVRSGLESGYGAVDRDVKAYTIGVARGGNLDWVNRRRRPTTTTTTTKSPEIISV